MSLLRKRTASVSTSASPALQAPEKPRFSNRWISRSAGPILSGGSDWVEKRPYYSNNTLPARARAGGMKLGQVPVGLKHIGNYSTRRMNVDGVSKRNRERYEGIVRELLIAA